MTKLNQGWTRRACWVLALLLGAGGLGTRKALQSPPEDLPEVRFHLTARPFQPLRIPPEAYLDVIEGICRYTLQLQNQEGAVIDPFLNREHQYATPYFAFAVAALLQAGRAPDLLPAGTRAMNHATRCFAAGAAAIPDQHGEFFIPALTGALELFHGRVEEPVWAVWRERLRAPLFKVIDGFDQHTNNWRAYAMKGEWMRVKRGLADRLAALSFIERSWHELQRERMITTRGGLYLDHSSDPEPQAVEAVGRGNLLGLILEGYDGPSAAEIRRLVEQGTRSYLLMQDPTGQAPPNGRADDHVWNDLIAQLGFEVMAEVEHRRGRVEAASRYRRAALLSFQSFQRWRRSDGRWAGSFYVTKNRFDPARRIGYQPASQYTNYNGTLMMHLAEAYLSRRTEIEQIPAPSEIGGYLFASDSRFGSAFANAGGMQVMANLRGEVDGKYGIYWTPLGVVRFSRAGWESRLGPSDGVRDQDSKRGVTFAPTWKEGEQWVRLADLPEEYRGELVPEFVSPLLVKFSIHYKPRRDARRPAFQMALVVTPDGVLAGLTGPPGAALGVTWPLLEDDGQPLRARLDHNGASTSYSDQGDEQHFLSLGRNPSIEPDGEPVLSPYGWLRPLRVTVSEPVNETWVYPRSPQDPPAEDVRKSFARTAGGFRSLLGRVEGNLYVGRTSAGGEGRAVDLDEDGKPDVRFSATCVFVLQLEGGRVAAVEVDRAVKATIQGQDLQLDPYQPVRLP